MIGALADFRPEAPEEIDRRERARIVGRWRRDLYSAPILMSEKVFCFANRSLITLVPTFCLTRELSIKRFRRRLLAEENQDATIERPF